MDAPNNHGVWYDAEALLFAVFVNNQTVANATVERAAKRLYTQIDSSGLFPKELERTISLHYSTFVVDAFTIIAQLSAQTNSDFWNLTTPSGKSLEKAYNALLPYYVGVKAWLAKTKPLPTWMPCRYPPSSRRVQLRKHHLVRAGKTGSENV
jgi:hypothetical protein